MGDFGDEAGQAFESQSERLAMEVVRALLNKRVSGKGAISGETLDKGFVSECKRTMATVDFDPDDPNNIELDFETVRWDIDAEILTDPFTEAEIPYVMTHVKEGVVRFTLHPDSVPYVKTIADRYINSTDERLKNFTRTRFLNYEVLETGLSPSAPASPGFQPSPQVNSFNLTYRPPATDAKDAIQFREALDKGSISHSFKQTKLSTSATGASYRFTFSEKDAPSIRRISDDLRKRFDPSGKRPATWFFPDYDTLSARVRIPSEDRQSNRDVLRFEVPDRDAAKLVEEGFIQEGIAFEAYQQKDGQTAFVMFNHELDAKRPAMEKVLQGIENGSISKTASINAANIARETTSRTRIDRSKKYDVDRKGERRFEKTRQETPDQTQAVARESAKARNDSVQKQIVNRTQSR